MENRKKEKQILSTFSTTKPVTKSSQSTATAFHYRNGQTISSTLLNAIKIINDRNSKCSDTSFLNSLQLLQTKTSEKQIPKRNNNYTIAFKDFVKNKKPQNSDFKCLICYETFSINDGFKCSPVFVTVEELQQQEQHIICQTCLKDYAHNACFEGLVGYGGLGLKCVDPECKNVILLSDFERHINEEDYEPLQNRLQEQCIIDAGLADLVTCSKCGLKSCVDILLTFFTCNCGNQQCRNCPRVYDAHHEEKTCAEMDLEETSSNSLESQMSEIIIRKCHNCNLAFVKNGGCNKMECSRCGSTQCYVCREPDINYNHFCNCNLDELAHGKCEECGKNCRNTELPEELDEIALQQIQNQFND